MKFDPFLCATCKHLSGFTRDTKWVLILDNKAIWDAHRDHRN